MDITAAIEKYSGMAIDYAPTLVLAILTLIVGFWGWMRPYPNSFHH